MSLTTSNPTDLRKAAILFRSLEPESAAVLLGQLSADEARVIRAAIRELGEIDDEERQGVAQALRAQSGPPPSQDEQYGVELQLTSPAADLELFEPETLPEPHTDFSSTPSVDAHPFSALPQLEDVDAATLASYLLNENAGVIAVVLSNLPADRAAAMLEELPFDLRTESLDRLAGLGDGDAESLKVLAADLGAWVAQQQDERQRQASRLETIGAILQAVAPESRDGLLRGLSNRGRKWVDAVTPKCESSETVEDETSTVDVDTSLPTPAIAEEALKTEEESEGEEPAGMEVIAPSQLVASPPRRVTVPFTAIEKLPPSLLAQVMKRTPSRQLLLALAGAPEGLQKRIESLIPSRQRRQLRKRLDSLGATNLREIESAQTAMAITASDLWSFFYDKPKAHGHPAA